MIIVQNPVITTEQTRRTVRSVTYCMMLCVYFDFLYTLRNNTIAVGAQSVSFNTIRGLHETC